MRKFTFTLFTNDPELAKRADEAGIERIGPDLEIVGKHQRQGHLDSRISSHSIEDFIRVRAVLKNASAFVRVNPIHPHSRQEISALLDHGAEVIMLPMFHTVDEAKTFIELVDGRAKVILLVETAAAALRLKQILDLPGIDEIHFGLNDLQLSFGVDSRLEILQSDLMLSMCETAKMKGVPYGIGGIATVGDENLPIHSDLFYQAYARLGAHGSIISRAFLTRCQNMEFEINRSRERLAQLMKQT